MTSSTRPALVGDLRIRDDAILYSAELPELRDVRIISMSPQAFTLAGFQRVDGAEYAQWWLVQSTAR